MDDIRQLALLTFIKNIIWCFKSLSISRLCHYHLLWIY